MGTKKESIVIIRDLEMALLEAKRIQDRDTMLRQVRRIAISSREDIETFLSDLAGDYSVVIYRGYLCNYVIAPKDRGEIYDAIRKSKAEVIGCYTCSHSCEYEIESVIYDMDKLFVYPDHYFGSKGGFPNYADIVAEARKIRDRVKTRA